MEKSTFRLLKPVRFHFLALLFLVATAILASISSAQNQLRTPASLDPALETLKRGYDRLQAKDFDAAIAALSDPLIQRQTLLGDYALFYRGKALSGAGRSEEAERDFVRIATIDPKSILIDDAIIAAAESAIARGAYLPAIEYLRPLAEKNVADALKLRADAFEKLGRPNDAVTALRRLYFYAPESQEASEVTTRLVSLGSSVLPVSAAEQKARADRLYVEELWVLAAQAYDLLARQFPEAATDDVWLRNCISSYRMNSYQAAIDALSRVRARLPKDRAEVLYFTGLAQFALKRSDLAVTTLGELLKTAPDSPRAPQLLYEFGRMSDKANQVSQAISYYQQLIDKYPSAEPASDAHFWLAWNAHQTRTYAQSAQLLYDHLVQYGDSTDNRGKAAFWAAVDSERAGNKPLALALYKALLKRYGAGWYGVNAERRIKSLETVGITAKSPVGDERLARAIKNLDGITIAPETAGSNERPYLAKAEQLARISLVQETVEVLREARQTAPNSPLINLKLAQALRAENENAAAINALKRAYPDYGQTLPQEMSREVWTVFYPIGWWPTIQQEARKHNLDPYLVAGIIRQETIFNPQARSRANALGLMQLMPATGRTVARKYSLGGGRISTTDLFNPTLSIQLGTAYLSEMIDEFGRFEYAAAAYNGGPTRVSRWLRELPSSEIEDWVDSIPISETRLYVQGVYRNARHYQRLYDDQGRFRSIVPQ